MRGRELNENEYGESSGHTLMTIMKPGGKKDFGGRYKGTGQE